MASKDDAPLSPGWQAPEEIAPSLVRPDEPRVARAVGFVGLLMIAVGGAALMAAALNWRSRVGPGWGVVLFVAGLGGLLFHAANEKDLQYRRTYGTLGFAWLLAGIFFSLVPMHQRVGSMLSPYGLCSFSLGLLFLLPFARNETDPVWQRATLRTLGLGGAALALAGLIGGNLSEAFLVSKGLPLLLLGLFFVWAFVGLEGSSSPLGYRAGLGLGAAGLLMFLIALGRSVLPPLFHSWGWTTEPPRPYLVPSGLLLMTAGLFYLAVAVGICVDNNLVVLTRRELAAFFYSPLAYIVFIGVAVIGWVQFYRFARVILFLSSPRSGMAPVESDFLIEPVVYHYVVGLFPVIAVIFLVPVLTMRLLSEENRSGTLEVMLTAPVREVTVVLGKFLAAFIMFLLVWLTWGVFLVGLRVEGGRPFDFRPLLSFYVALACTGAGFVSMGLFFSSLTRSQIAAAILTFVGMMGLTGVYLIAQLPAVGEKSALATVLSYISYIDLWFRSSNGSLAPRYLVFHLSAAVFWLFLTTKVLEARKWS